MPPEARALAVQAHADDPHREGQRHIPPTADQVEQIKKLASIACTLDEIAYVTKFSREYLIRHCRDIIREGAMVRNVSLRRKQMKMAMDGDKTMLIWLGKQLLDQTDRLRTDGTNLDEVKAPIELHINFVEAKDGKPFIEGK